MTNKFDISKFGLVGRGLALMTRREIATVWMIVSIMMVAGFLESVVVALIVPLVYVIIAPEKLAATTVGQYVSALFGGRSFDELFGYLAAALIVLLLVSSLVTMLATYKSERHSARCRDRLARELLATVVAAPYVWVIQHSTAVLVRHIHDDVRAWRKEFVHAILMIVQAVIMIIAPAAVAVAMAPIDGLLALGIVGLSCAAIVYGFRRRIRSISYAVKTQTDGMMKTILQILSGIREVKVSGRAGYFVGMFDRFHSAVNRLGISARMVGGAPASAINLLGQIGFIATALILWTRGTAGTEIVAQLALIGVVVSRVLPAFNRLSSQVAILFRAAPFVESLLQFREQIDRSRREYGRSENDGVAVSPDWRRIKLEDVWFRYPAAAGWSLEAASINLERGKFYGFVGQSGAGKTTLANLLLGLIEPTRGAVKIDDRSLTEISLQDWRRRFGYVPQDAFIFDATLRDNITLGEIAADELVRDAVARAGLSDVVGRLESGLDTVLGERGRRFSGGQAQRVAIARALFRRPEILFFDEATSALDSITESEVHLAIEGLRGEAMAIMIAHRVTSLRRCDRIFMLDGGRVVDSGTYGELLQRSDVFRRLAAQSDDARPVPV